jgi:hypothetical protein
MLSTRFGDAPPVGDPHQRQRIAKPRHRDVGRGVLGVVDRIEAHHNHEGNRANILQQAANEPVVVAIKPDHFIDKTVLRLLKARMAPDVVGGSKADALPGRHRLVDIFRGQGHKTQPQPQLMSSSGRRRVDGRRVPSELEIVRICFVASAIEVGN